MKMLQTLIAESDLNKANDPSTLPDDSESCGCRGERIKLIPISLLIVGLARENEYKSFVLCAFSLIVAFVLAVRLRASRRFSGRMRKWTVLVIGDFSMWEMARPIAGQIEKLGSRCAWKTFPDRAAGQFRARVLETGRSSNMRLEALPGAVRDAEVVVMFANPEVQLILKNPWTCRVFLCKTAWRLLNRTMELYVND